MQPKVVNLDALRAETRAYLLGGLRGAFAAQPSRARGLGWSIAFAIIAMIVWWFHANEVQHSYRGTLYSPTTFVYMAVLAFLTVLPLIAWVRMRGSLRRQPSQGVFLIGANTVVATEHDLTIYPFAQSQFTRMAINLTIACLGRVFTFALPGRVFEVEQTAKANANALAAAVHYGDQAQIQALDPFLALPATPPAKRPLGAWLIALPATTLSLPLVFLLERRVDDSWYERVSGSDYYGDSYIHSGGRHAEALRIQRCDARLAKAETPPAIREVVQDMCDDYRAQADQKLANLYAKIRAQLESMPAKSRPVLLELLDASIQGPVSAKFVVTPPTAADLADIDKRLDKAKITDVVRLTGNFAPSSMDSRTAAIRDAIVREINALGPSEAFRVVEDDKAASPGLTITLAYSLEPMIQGDQIIIYRETGLGAYRSTVFLGLRTHIELTLKSKTSSYNVVVDAEPQAHVSHDTSASDTGIYNAITDSAFDDLHKELKAKLFPTTK